MPTSEFKAVGFTEALNFLKGLDEKTNRKLLVSSMRVAAKPLVKSAKALAPEFNSSASDIFGNKPAALQGALKRSIGVITVRQKKSNEAIVYVGPKKLKTSTLTKRKKQGNYINKNDGWFRHFIIKGTAGYTIKKGKAKGTYMPGQKANPFMDKAANITKQAVENGLTQSITKAVNSYIKRKGITLR